MKKSECIIIENKHYSLAIDQNCVAISLINKANGEECIKNSEKIPLFSLTEERPYNNEIKLAHPNKRTVFQANKVRKEDDKLIVGFEILGFEAVVKVNIKDDYISFKLEKFNVEKVHFGILSIDVPPVLQFRLLQIPVKNREKFGDWLNVSWDENTAVCVLATSPYTLIDCEKYKDHTILFADAHRDIELFETEAALIVSNPEVLLDCIDELEKDYNLPNGVKSRRNDAINNSIYSAVSINPSNVDKHIKYAKQGGFSKMLIYYAYIFHEEGAYQYCNDFEYDSSYPNGDDDLKNMIDKIRLAGITPGIHFLHPHIGIKSKYVTPVADYRLNLTRHFTLSKPLGIDDKTVYVAQNPKGAVMCEKCRVLMFDGELIHYEAYTKEPPFCFTGCKRGYFNTNIIPHNEGTIGGILDISEYCAESVYIDQETDLQDEIADKLAHVYDMGMEFAYFDGSEGTDAPYEFEIPYAQYRVFKKFKKEPLFAEGAAKAHFSWHMLSGGNAFDVFPTKVFKESIAKYPLEEASRMAQDFTRLNFGWWAFYDDTQADIYEYGTSRAASWDCPVTMKGVLEKLETNPRTDDILEVMRRWEDVRAKKWLTQAQKDMLKSPTQEHTLLINENGDYELVPYEQIKNAAGGNEFVRAFVFERQGKTYVVCWHTKGTGKLSLNIDAGSFTYEEDIGKEKLNIERKGESSSIIIGKKSYFSTDIKKEEVVKIFESAELVEY